jgi:tetratricopeptide (TPR) repeat protein
MPESRKPTSRARRRAAAEPTTPDPVEIALEAAASGVDPEPESAAGRLLRQQERLIAWQVASERAAFTLRMLTIGAGVVVAGLVGWAVWDASRYQGLVVEAFSVPPDLASRGLTGQAAASQLLDNLVRTQAETDSVRSPGSYSIDWGDDVQVEIPQTGVSLGDLQRWLRQQLGRQTRISGVIYRLPDGRLSVTARAGGAVGASFEGPDAELGVLMAKSAESVYGLTQPYRYSVFLKRHERWDEALALLERQAASGPLTERAWGHVGWGNLLRDRDFDHAAAIEHYKAAEALDPRAVLPPVDTAGSELALGRWEAGLASGRRVIANARRGRGGQMHPEARVLFVAVVRAQNATLLGDHNGAIATWRRALQGTDFNNNFLYLPWQIDEARLAMHDPAPLRARIAQTPSVTEAWDVHGWSLWSRPIRLAIEDQNWAAAAAAGDRIEADIALLSPQQQRSARLSLPTNVWPDLAYALARAGRLPEAEALVARTPLDCYPCLVARGRVAAAAGDRPRAERWFAEAVRQGPSLPLAHTAWGEARALWGDDRGAIALYRQARQRGPRWADPLKLEADSLARLGDRREAAARYREALRIAPKWQAARGALAALGRAG